VGAIPQNGILAMKLQVFVRFVVNGTAIIDANFSGSFNRLEHSKDWLSLNFFILFGELWQKLNNLHVLLAKFLRNLCKFDETNF